MAQPSSPRSLTPEALPAGMTVFPLRDIFSGWLGFATDDGVCFLADCLSGENILEKYHVSFIYDVAAYLETLDRVEQMQARLFVPAHAAATGGYPPHGARQPRKGAGGGRPHHGALQRAADL